MLPCLDALEIIGMDQQLPVPTMLAVDAAARMCAVCGSLRPSEWVICPGCNGSVHQSCARLVQNGGNEPELWCTKCLPQTPRQEINVESVHMTVDSDTVLHAATGSESPLAGQKRKRKSVKSERTGKNVLTIAQRMEMISEWESHKAQRGVKASLARKYNVSRAQVTRIIQDQDKHRASFEAAVVMGNASRMRSQTGKFHEVEVRLHDWVSLQEQRSRVLKQPLSLTMDMVCAKAEKIALTLELREFKPTVGWFFRFKKRWGLDRLRGFGDMDDTVDASLFHPPIHDEMIIPSEKPAEVNELAHTAAPGDVDVSSALESCRSGPSPSLEALEQVMRSLHEIREFAHKYSHLHPTVTELADIMIKAQRIVETLQRADSSRAEGDVTHMFEV